MVVRREPFSARRASPYAIIYITQALTRRLGAANRRGGWYYTPPPTAAQWLAWSLSSSRASQSATPAGHCEADDASAACRPAGGRAAPAGPGGGEEGTVADSTH